MQHKRIDPMEWPLKNGERWWVVHPNNAKCIFRIPSGAITVCTEKFYSFLPGTVYRVVGSDDHNGWVTVEGNGDLYDMPQYLFARYFDAESFVVGVATQEELEKAKPAVLVRDKNKNEQIIPTNFSDKEETMFSLRQERYTRY